MDFIEKIQELSKRIPIQINHIQTEEATKSTFVMSIIQTLRYDLFNPLEVVHYRVADVETKKGEKVVLLTKLTGKILDSFQASKYCSI